MARYIENDCVGCPQGCINCGRQKDYWVYECDRCGNVDYTEDFLTDCGNGELCDDCLKEFEKFHDIIDVKKIRAQAIDEFVGVIAKRICFSSCSECAIDKELCGKYSDILKIEELAAGLKENKF